MLVTTYVAVFRLKKTMSGCDLLLKFSNAYYSFFNFAGNLNLNGSIGLGVMPLSIQGVIKYQIMFSVAYLGCGCVRTTLCLIWIHVLATLHTIYFLMKYFQFG